MCGACMLIVSRKVVTAGCTCSTQSLNKQANASIMRGRTLRGNQHQLSSRSCICPRGMLPTLSLPLYQSVSLSVCVLSVDDTHCHLLAVRSL